MTRPARKWPALLADVVKMFRLGAVFTLRLHVFRLPLEPVGFRSVAVAPFIG